MSSEEVTYRSGTNEVTMYRGNNATIVCFIDKKSLIEQGLDDTKFDLEQCTVTMKVKKTADSKIAIFSKEGYIFQPYSLGKTEFYINPEDTMNLKLNTLYHIEIELHSILDDKIYTVLKTTLNIN